ncbi:MAG: calcium/sodium antiporter [Opitutales bacterium]
MTLLAFISIPYASFAVWLLLILMVVGIALLYFGGDYLTQGASGLALGLKINPIVVGLTVVSIATSAPELLTALFAVMAGQDDLAMGNIVGSNLANIGLIFGIGAMVFPIGIQRRLIKVENPILMAVTLTFFFFCFEGEINRTEGIILLLIMAVAITLLVKFAKSGTAPEGEEIESAGSVPKSVIFVVIGSVGLALGASVLVDSSKELAGRLGVSEALIGATMVAIGTSLPELAATIVAAARKEADLIAGNIIGSNFFNLVLIGGAVAVVKPIAVSPTFFSFQLPAVLVATALMWILSSIGKNMTRRDGIILLVFYAVVIGVIVQQEFVG